MKPAAKLGIVIGLAVVVAGAVTMKKSGAGGACCVPLIPATATSTLAVTSAPAPNAISGVPRLLDLGADKCIPCKMMVPVLDELKREYAGRLDVEFIDVWKNPDAGKLFNVEMIPTQIFFDSTGKELFRHTGFFGKEDILAKWKELGVGLEPTKSVGQVK